MKTYVAIPMCLIVLFACAKKEKMEISGGPYRLDLQNGDSIGYIDAGITSEADPGVINVAVNGFEVGSASDTSVDYYFKVDSIPHPGMAYSVTIETDIGTAIACCTLPGNFHINAPPDYDTIDTPLIIAWDPTTHADRYDVYTEILYFDTVNTLIFKDTVISTSDVQIVLDQSWFGDLATEGDMTIKVFAVNGAGAVNDSNSNVTGGTGNWMAMHGRHKSVNVYKR